MTGDAFRAWLHQPAPWWLYAIIAGALAVAWWRAGHPKPDKRCSACGAPSWLTRCDACYAADRYAPAAREGTGPTEGSTHE